MGASSNQTVVDRRLLLDASYLHPSFVKRLLK